MVLVNLIDMVRFDILSMYMLFSLEFHPNEYHNTGISSMLLKNEKIWIITWSSILEFAISFVLAVSQIEHGVVSFGNTDDPRFTVVMDCEGILPVGFPSQMMRSCSGLMQAHYPNRLATLLVIKLPPESWELMQTFFQVIFL